MTRFTVLIGPRYMYNYIRTVPYFLPGLCWQLFGCHGRRKAKPWWQTGQAMCVVWYIEECGALRPVLVVRLTQRFSSAGGTSHSQVAGWVGRRYRLYVLAGPDVRCWWWGWHSPNWTGRSAYVHVQHECFSSYSATHERYCSWMCQDVLLRTLQDGASHERWSISGLSSAQEMFPCNVPLMTLQVKTIHKLKNRFLWPCRMIPRKKKTTLWETPMFF